MNIKSLALSALVALSTLGGAAEAAPTTCALRTTQDLKEFTCDRVIRTNSNGHKVNDVTFFGDGTRYDLTIILWTENDVPAYAETWINGERVVMDYYIAKNGAQCVSNNATQFCMF